MKALSHFRHFSNILSHNMRTELEYIMHCMMQWSSISYNCNGNLNIWNAVATEFFLTKNQFSCHTSPRCIHSSNTSRVGARSTGYRPYHTSSHFLPYCLGSHVVWFPYTFCTYSPFHCMFWNFHPACDGGDCWFLSFARNTWCSSLRSEWYYP